MGALAFAAISTGTIGQKDRAFAISGWQDPMKLKKRMDGDTEVIADGRGLARFLLAGCLLFSGLAVYHFIAGASNSGQFTGSVCALALFLLIFLVTFEYSRFVFRQSARVIDWRRRTLFSRQSGQVAFDAVECVAAEMALDHEPNTGGGLSRRLVLRTASGAIPFTRAYTGDPDGEMLRIAARLNAMFGRDSAAEILKRARELVAAGREIDAARLIRAERGISLKAAQEEVRSLNSDEVDLQQPDMQGEPGANAGHGDHRPPALPPAAMAALARDNKVDAIRYVRMAYGLGLKEAADLVESHLQGHG